MFNAWIITKPQDEQRYDTVGDWRYRTTEYMLPYLDITVSDMDNSDYEFLVAIHELVEAHLCRKRGIKEEDVTAFDEAFEKLRKEDNFDEPGNDVRAPYYKEHQFATMVEKLIALEIGVNWDEYDKTVNSL